MRKFALLHILWAWQGDFLRNICIFLNFLLEILREML